MIYEITEKYFIQRVVTIQIDAYSKEELMEKYHKGEYDAKTLTRDDEPALNSILIRPAFPSDRYSDIYDDDYEEEDE